MTIAALTVDIRALSPLASAWEGPLAFVDLDIVDEHPDPLILPPCPVIGLGDAAHPVAASLDAVLLPPISADMLLRQASANPHAAAVLTGLLRTLPKLPPSDGLMVESLAYGVLQGSAEHARWRAAQQPAGAPITVPGNVGVRRDGSTLRVVLDRADAGNAIDRQMRDQLAEAFALAAIDDTITRIALCAQGRTFSLGADIGEFGTTTDPAAAVAIRARTLPAHALARCAHKLHVHVQGGCVGSGLEMAAWACRLTASPGAWFHLPELAMGILPGAGGCVALTRRIGRQKTALLVLSGRRLNARQALEWGLVDAIVDQAPGNEGGADIAG